jgi:hypothetical protein
MLKEESYHLGTGNNGLLRIIKAGRIPPETVQKFFNKWVPTAFDLFGTDNSSSAHWAYEWGLKGRFDERENEHTAEKAKLNEASRTLYRDEVVRLVDRMNSLIPDRDRWLKVPDLRFNRRIGMYGHQKWNVEGTEEFSNGAYDAYLGKVLPQKEDYLELRALMRENDWIAPKKQDMADTA